MSEAGLSKQGLEDRHSLAVLVSELGTILESGLEFGGDGADESMVCEGKGEISDIESCGRHGILTSTILWS